MSDYPRAKDARSHSPISGFSFWLWFLAPACCSYSLWEAEVVAQVTGFQPREWEALGPDFILFSPGCCGHLEREAAVGSPLSLSPFLCMSPSPPPYQKKKKDNALLFQVPSNPRACLSSQEFRRAVQNKDAFIL